MPTVPADAPHSRAALVHHLNVAIREVDTLNQQRTAKEAEVRRLLLRLARLPEFQASPPPATLSFLPLKAAVAISKKSSDTLLRHGEPGGWCWKIGGRWVCDPVGLERFMRGASRA